ncbi:hypothetical protein BD414DRAFT_489847 [Trametes punicea]|nr:hypothetical protein BD414DRAFT_489847 [Trametes punicea]
MVFEISSTTSCSSTTSVRRSVPRPRPSDATMPVATTFSSAIDPASRINPLYHHPGVVEMVNMPMSSGVLDYFFNTVVLTVASAMIGPAHKIALELKTAKMTKFIETFLAHTRIGTPAVLVALVYLDRVREGLEIDREDWVCERLAVGALICAFKYINDAPVKAEYWAQCSGLFSKADVNRIEREFLTLLSFDMLITEGDLLEHYEGLMRATRADAEDAWRVLGRSVEGSVFTRRERTEYRYAIHPRGADARPSPAAPIAYGIPRDNIDVPGLTHLPDLMYLDSPDSYSTPSVITPPEPPRISSAAWHRHYDPHRTEAGSGVWHNPYLALQPPSIYPSQKSDGHGAMYRDAEMEARVQWYATDPVYGGPADSPRFEPFSPPAARYPSPPEYPWRTYHWPSASTCNVWGPSGLFKI